MTSTTLVLVRHAVALRRDEWRGPDRHRPLSPRGREQADALVVALGEFEPGRVLSSPATRCFETVGPLAASFGLEVEEVDELYEGSGTDALDLLAAAASGAAAGAVVACSHGDVLPELLRALAGHLRDDVPYHPPFAKGAAWVVDARSARYLAPPA